jgi:hypothetical protein
MKAMYDPPYAVWSIWQSCGWLERIVLILVGGLIIYSLRSAVLTFMRLRSLRAVDSVGGLDVAKTSTLILQKHWVRIGQVTAAMFYVFGLVLFLVLQTVAMIVGDMGPASATNQVLRNFVESCAFAANVFFGFLLLHVVQWVVSSRISASLEALGSKG